MTIKQNSVLAGLYFFLLFFPIFFTLFFLNKPVTSKQKSMIITPDQDAGEKAQRAALVELWWRGGPAPKKQLR